MTLDGQSCKKNTTRFIHAITVTVQCDLSKLQKGDKEMKLKTALFIGLKIIALTVILFICWSVAGGVMGL